MKKKTRLGMQSLLLALCILLFPLIVCAEGIEIDLEDGEYAIEVELIGGSGKAGVSSPTLMIVKDAKAYARLVWSSSNYDYMLVDGVKYLNEAEEETNSTFTIPILAMDKPMEVVGDTLAMGTPHEVQYDLTFFSATIDSKSTLPQEAAKRVVMIALVIIVGGGILNAYVKKKLRE